MKLGVQLYSLYRIQSRIDSDPEAVLKDILDIGFKHLEPANTIADADPGTGYRIPADRLLELFEPYGARIGSAHIGPITDDTLPEILKFHQKIGNKNIVWAIEFYNSYDNIMRRCEDYNRFGKFLVENGMNPLSYHNHYHEFALVNGKPILYHIIDNTDPKYVNFEMDTGWDIRAGRDPIAELEHVGNRLRLIHIKDFRRTPPNLLLGKPEWINWDNFGANHQDGDPMTPGDFVEIGDGMMPIQKILDTASALGAESAVLEQDDGELGIIESLKISYEKLKSYKNLEI